MSAGSDTPTLELDPDLYARLVDRVDESEFKDAAAYVEYVLDSLFAELEGETGADGADDEVRDRLEELGYLE
jgi:hypothetical protein